MKQLSTLLENFDGDPVIGRDAASLKERESEELETARLEAFDKGYRAGWDDAFAANAAEQLQIGADLAQNLRDLSFTYNEALFHAASAMSGLLSEIVQKVLPRSFPETIAAHITDVLTEMTQSAAQAPVEIVVSPENVDRVANHLGQDFGFPVRVSGNQTTGPGQAEIYFSDHEAVIDLEAILEQIIHGVSGLQTRAEHGGRDARSATA